MATLVAGFLGKNIPGAVFGYTQSDEISIVLVDYQTLETDSWFDYRVTKMCSIGASMASRFFNQHYIENVKNAYDETSSEYAFYSRKFFSADFDCRAFNIPKEDACNCLIWRQKDAEKNSIRSLGQTLFKASELDGVKNKDLLKKMI